MKNKFLRTGDRMICDKLNSLHIKNKIEVLIDNKYQKVSLTKMLNNINSSGRILDFKFEKNKVLIQKVNAPNFRVYHKI